MMRLPVPVLLAAGALLAAAAACDARLPRSPGAADGDAVALAACTRCHGDPANGNAAPPRSTRGAATTADLAVGAHQAHLQDGPIAQAMACASCHVVPAMADALTHADGKEAAVTFGGLALAAGAKPAWSPAQASCATTYCHGATLAGGANTSPVWTKVDGTQAACGSCHGLPPPASTGHPAVSGGVTACAGCHPGTVKPDGTIDVAGGLHVNGVVDGPGAAGGGGGCTSCHGDPANGNAAPPRGTHGETSTSDRAVGAHQAHLHGGAIRGAVACAECHAVPASAPHANGTVDVTFGPLATAQGSASWNGATCATYCHGATLAGGTLTAPSWTKVGQGQAACGTCHGLPPPASTGHPAVTGGVTACAGCHPGTVKPDGTIDVAGGLHVNGTVDLSGGGGGGATCTSCHGDPANGNAAPPRGTHGETSTSTRAVGAHQAHLAPATSANLARPIACGECHVVPTSIPHANGTVDVAFGTLARTGGRSPSWNGTSCSASYCHGASLTGGTNKAPSWTGGAGQAACGTCHGVPPSSGHHGDHSGRSCGDCHGGSYSRSAADPSLHVNGKIDVGNRITSWDPATRTCVGCHGQERW